MDPKHAKLNFPNRTSYFNMLTIARSKGSKIPLTSEQAWKLHEIRSSEEKQNKPKSNTITIPLFLGIHSDVKKRLLGRKSANIEGTYPSITSRIDTATSRYSGQCRYTKYEYTVYIQSFAKVIGKHLLYTIETDNGIKHGKFVFPRGYALKIEDNHPVMFQKMNPKNDLHLDSLNILNGPKSCVRVLKENAFKRKQIEAQTKEKQKILNDKSIWINVQDAKLAGNCAQGIRNFAQRLNVDIENPYFALPAKIALNRANEYERERVENTIFVAWQRQTCVAI